MCINYKPYKTRLGNSGMNVRSWLSRSAWPWEIFDSVPLFSWANNSITSNSVPYIKRGRNIWKVIQWKPERSITEYIVHSLFSTVAALVLSPNDSPRDTYYRLTEFSVTARHTYNGTDWSPIADLNKITLLALCMSLKRSCEISHLARMICMFVVLSN